MGERAGRISSITSECSERNSPWENSNSTSGPSVATKANLTALCIVHTDMFVVSFANRMLSRVVEQRAVAVVESELLSDAVHAVTPHRRQVGQRQPALDHSASVSSDGADLVHVAIGVLEQPSRRCAALDLRDVTIHAESLSFRPRGSNSTQSSRSGRTRRTHNDARRMMTTHDDAFAENVRIRIVMRTASRSLSDLVSAVCRLSPSGQWRHPSPGPRCR